MSKIKRFVLLIFLFIILFVILIGIPIRVIYAVDPKEFSEKNNWMVTIIAAKKNLLGLESFFGKLEIFAKIDSLDKLHLFQDQHKEILRVKSDQDQKDVSISIGNNLTNDSIKINLSVSSNYDDSDQDGFPDILELNSELDRQNFRRWFRAIALSQYFHKDDQWIDRDCAGLVRFCYKESLRKHGNDWLSKKKFLFDFNFTDVEKFNFPNLPLINDRIFRKNPKTFNLQDTIQKDSIFCNFVEAKYLMSSNLTFISKNILEALPGDIIIFYNDLEIKWPYHLMIFIGNDEIGEKDIVGDWVIYHTGPNEDNPGIVKKIRLSDLKIHPNKRWHPVPSNKYFLGFFRWNILI